MEALKNWIHSMDPAIQKYQQTKQEILKNMEVVSFEIVKKVFFDFADRTAKKELQNNFIFNDGNLAQIELFIALFSGNYEKVMPEFSAKKGLLIIGNVGSGKTFLFKVLNEIYNSDETILHGNKTILIKQLFKRTGLINCKVLANQVGMEGESLINKYTTQSVYFDSFSGKLIMKHCCFDDFGSEENKMHFGAKINSMEEIISGRYDLFMGVGLQTHFTSNLSLEEIKTTYGDRIYSRLSQMCNVMVFGSGDDYVDYRKFSN